VAQAGLHGDAEGAEHMKANIWAEYERFKAALRAKKPTQAEYEAAIARWLRKHRL